MKPGNREERVGVVHRLTTIIDQAVGIIRWIAQPSLAQLMLRLALAVPFWKSGILKWNGFLQLNDTAIYLFTDEFKLHLPGGPYDFPAPAVMAFLSGSGEIIFPVLLVLGFGTRFAAFGLLLMTCIVELTVPDGWPIHITWAAMALAIMAWGPGRLSIDHALCRLPGLRADEAGRQHDHGGAGSIRRDRPLLPDQSAGEKSGEDQTQNPIPTKVGGRQYRP
jgi:putative oxidoreductase